MITSPSEHDGNRLKQKFSDYMNCMREKSSDDRRNHIAALQKKYMMWEPYPSDAPARFYNIPSLMGAIARIGFAGAGYPDPDKPTIVEMNVASFPPEVDILKEIIPRVMWSSRTKVIAVIIAFVVDWLYQEGEWDFSVVLINENNKHCRFWLPKDGDGMIVYQVGDSINLANLPAPTLA